MRRPHRGQQQAVALGWIGGQPIRQEERAARRAAAHQDARDDRFHGCHSAQGGLIFELQFTDGLMHGAHQFRSPGTAGLRGGGGTRQLPRAAEDLHLSQPALSRRVDKLEAQLGALLERTTRRVSLTNIGRVFLERARTAIDELESAVLSIGDLATQREGLITVACVPSVAYYFLPTIIHEYSLRFPASACASLTKRPTRCSTASYRAVPISASASSAPRNPTWTSRPCCAKTSCLPFATTTRCRAAAASPGMSWRASAT